MDEAAEAASTTEPIIAQVVREATATDAERFPVVLASFVGVHDVCLPNAVPYGDADTTVYSRKRRRRPETPVVRSASGGMAPISVTPRGPSVMHPRSLPTMGTLGTYLVHYHGTFGMDAFGEDEFQLEDVRASGYLDRMDSILNDHQTRKHTLTLVPPDAYNSAVYMQRVAQSAQVNQINYLFAESLQIFQDPSTGRPLITVDTAVAERLQQLGFESRQFDTVRSLAELEQRFAGFEHPRVCAPETDDRDQVENSIDADEVREAVNQVLSEPPRIPPELTKGFRAEVIGSGNVASFRPRLLAAMKEPFEWKGQTYAPLKEWTLGECKKAWCGAGKAACDRWEQAVMEMKQVHVFLSMHGAGEVEWDGDGEIELASYTKVRQSMKAYAKRCADQGGRLDYESLCAM